MLLRKTICSLIVLTLALRLAALELPNVFSDHMVLQQGMPIQVWGKAEPNQAITVSFAGKSVTTTTDPGGRWRAELPVQAASFEPRVLSVSDGTNTKEFHDVLVGEVWLCSGQSNMSWSVAASKDADIEQLIAQHPNLRWYKVNQRTAQEPRFSDEAVWEICSPQTVGHFSAVGYYFARDLQQVLDVPVGMLQAAWGGTPAIAWTRAEDLDKHPQLVERRANYDALVETYPKRLAQWEAAQQSSNAPTYHEDPGITSEFAGASATNFDDTAWKSKRLPSDWQDIMPEHDGAVWFRQRFSLPENMRGQPLTYHSGPVDDFDDVWLNGVRIGGMNAADHQAWAMPRRYEIPASLTNTDTVVIAIRMFDRFAGAGMLGRETDFFLEADNGKHLPLAGPWRYAIEARLPASTGPSGRQQRPWGAPDSPHRPAALAGGMLAPVAPYTIRGAIWYQGENDAGWFPQDYDERLRVMIEGWREWWGRPDMPFGIVQLANFMQPNHEPSDANWAKLREAQRDLANELPNTGLAVAIDIGESDDIHPHNKTEVGRRLARWALADVYDQIKMRGGPELLTATATDGSATLTFSQVGQRLRAFNGPQLNGFTLAGPDGVFHVADATITAPNTVVVQSKAVPNPKQVRYGWDNNPVKANLSTLARLPASPFEADLEPVIDSSISRPISPMAP